MDEVDPEDDEDPDGAERRTRRRSGASQALQLWKQEREVRVS